MRKYVVYFGPMYVICILVCIILSISVERTVTTISENRIVQRNIVFVIDAGHGGEDGGAVSCTGITESSINLQIALRLDDLLHLLGYETVMIRKTDISVYTDGATIAARKLSDLKQRVKMVNETEHGILLSIHQNIFPEGKYHGAQVFYNDHSGAKEMAQALQNNFAATINSGSKRQCKSAKDIYLMDHIRHPGLLIECGFLSNAEEEGKLRSEEYQKKICCVIASSVSNRLN